MTNQATTDTLQRIVGMLAEANVGKPTTRCVTDEHEGKTRIRTVGSWHPLHDLYQGEGGISVACPGEPDEGRGAKFCINGYLTRLNHPEEGGQGFPHELCKGTGRVLRDTSAWPESAVRGWLMGLAVLLPPVGVMDEIWMELTDNLADWGKPLEAMALALESAVQVEIAGGK